MLRLAAILFLFATSQAWAAFGYYSPISINAAQVPGTETDFPVLVLQTDNRFKTVANGGHVQDAQGDDIRPYTDSGLGTAITGYEKVFYDGTTGTIEMWVKVSSLTSSSTPFVLAYGDSGITTDGSSTTTWSNGFLGVYHLADGTTLNVNSATGTHNGTNINTVTATSGQIDGAGSFASASSQYIDLGASLDPTAITISAWVRATTFPGAYNGVFATNNGTNQALILVKSTGKLAVYMSATTTRSYDGTGSNTLSADTWYDLAATYNSTAGLIGYVNAGVDGTASANGVLLLSATPHFDIGRDAGAAGRFWNGKIDEARISSVARSANWITTEYNNQVAPGTFETLGSEVAVTTSGNSNFFMFFP